MFYRRSVSSIGRLASELVEHPGAGAVLGVSSRGVFIRLTGDWVVFLSRESWRGPLTLNLAGRERLPEGLQTGDPVENRKGVLVFPTIQTEISTENVTVWEAPPLPGAPLTIEQRKRRLRQLVRKMGEEILHRNGAKDAGNIYDEKKWGSNKGLDTLIEHLWGEKCEARVKEACRKARAGLETGDAAAATLSLSPLLGLGEGLTPAGDDLVGGLLLALRRWGKALGYGMDVEMVAAPLIERARTQTSLLSLSLLRCSTQGQADERLVTALDRLVCGSISVMKCLELLGSWGSSSGYAAMVGISVVIS